MDLRFTGANSVSADYGLADNNWEVVQVKKAILKSAGKTAVLSISEKLDTVQRLQVCQLHSIN